MKHLGIRTFSFLALFLCLAFSACKKNVPGPQGDPGEPGGKGNLKQIDRSFTVYPTSWSFNGGWFSTDIFFPEITEEVMSKGEVKVFMKIGTHWWTLPYAVGDIFMEQTTETGLLHLKYSKIHDGAPPPPGERVFRVVVYSPA